MGVECVVIVLAALSHLRPPLLLTSLDLQPRTTLEVVLLRPRSFSTSGGSLLRWRWFSLDSRDYTSLAGVFPPLEEKHPTEENKPPMEVLFLRRSCFSPPLEVIFHPLEVIFPPRK